MRSTVVVCLLGCGGGGQSPPADAAPDAFVLPPLVFQTLVMSQQTLPANNTEARELGLDLNGDQTIDNQLGMVVGVFAGQGFITQQETDTAIDRGELIQLIRFGLEDSATPRVGTFEAFTGTNPLPAACNAPGDPTCRRHLDGSASFELDPLGAQNDFIVGDMTGQQFKTPRVAFANRLQLLTTMGANVIIPLDLLGARISVTVGANGMTNGIIGGAVSTTDLDTKVLPAWQQSFSAVVARDCTNTTPPDCGCPSGSPGDTAIGLFDFGPQDCVITRTEIENNSLIQSLLAPDVTIDGQDGLSIGVGFEAVLGTFVAP